MVNLNYKAYRKNIISRLGLCYVQFIQVTLRTLSFVRLQVLYHVVHHRWMEPDVVKELLWRRHVYNNAIISLRKLFKEESAKNRYEGASFSDILLDVIFSSKSQLIKKYFPEIDDL